jgi:hypothetical protein
MGVAEESLSAVTERASNIAGEFLSRPAEA